VERERISRYISPRRCSRSSRMPAALWWE
jgi:hypothetical protein